MKRVLTVLLSPLSFLFALAALTYAPLFWQRGFYWDELPWVWAYFRLGPEALTRLFSTSRPVWGMLYQVTLPTVGAHPWVWQLLMVVLRWLTAVQVWLLLRRLWPGSRLALWAAALFLVYPGLGQNFVALMYSHFYIVFNFFLLSLQLSLLAAQKNRWPWHLAALALAGLNLLMMEYFYFLELWRLALLFLVTRRSPRQTARHFSPYFLLFVTVSVWRAFFFSNQNASYSYQTLADLRQNFGLGLWNLLRNMLSAFWESVPHAWLFPFEPVNLTTLGLFTALGSFLLALAGTLLCGLYLRWRSQGETSGQPLTLLGLGLLAWLLGGGAFWLVGARTLPQLHFSADRFTLPLMLGSSLMLAAGLGFLHKTPKFQFIALALLLGFAVGKQFQTNALYRRDWEAQRSLFWQLAWRIPALKPGTTLLTNDLPVEVSSDNSLSAPLNWMYDRRANLPSLPKVDGRVEMEYILYFASVRAQEGRALGGELKPGLEFTQNYLASYFRGKTSALVVINYAPPGCLRVLDPEIDPLNRLLPPSLRDAAFLSNPAQIGTEPAFSVPAFYGAEPARGWCSFFSAAELARQAGDWQRVTQLREQAQSPGEHPNDPLENFVFIEAYAHTGDWASARALTRETFRFSKEVMRPTLCALWRRLERDLGPAEAISAARQELACPAGD